MPEDIRVCTFHRPILPDHVGEGNILGQSYFSQYFRDPDFACVSIRDVIIGAVKTNLPYHVVYNSDLTGIIEWLSDNTSGAWFDVFDDGTTLFCFQRQDDAIAFRLRTS
jgi:hypothetical protein